MLEHPGTILPDCIVAHEAKADIATLKSDESLHLQRQCPGWVGGVRKVQCSALCVAGLDLRITSIRVMVFRNGMEWVIPRR